MTEASNKSIAAKARKLAADEKHERVRKRLIGVALVLEGVPLGKAVRQARMTHHGLRRWVEQAQNEGIESLLHLRTRALRAKRNPPLASRARELASGTLSARVRKRLLAVAMALEGANFIETALRFQSSYGCVRKWVELAETHGLQSLLRAQAGRNVDKLATQVSKLHHLATKAKDPGSKRKLAVLADVAAGMPVIEAAARAGVSANTITNWTRQFVEQGPRGMAMRATGPKLKDSEPGCARVIVKRGPPGAPGKMAAWTIAMLRTAIRKELGLWYSPKGIRGLLKRAGFTWVKRGPGRGREPLGIAEMKATKKSR